MWHKTWSRTFPWCWLWALLAFHSLAANAAEFRGLWVDSFGPGFLNAEEVKKLVKDCRQYNFNALVVEMRRRGDAFYNSKVDPRTVAIATNFDALAEVIKECHTGTPRIEVHCWVVGHFVWADEQAPKQPAHVFNRHPEYLTQDPIGQRCLSKGYYLDPGNPEANLTLYNMARDIVSHYDIDGLHWDYCRYPNQNAGYNATALRRFNEEFGLKGQPAPNDARFSDWRRRQVSDFLRWVNADLWELKPQLVISAAVFANLSDSCSARFADWRQWNQDGLIDVCMPMDFSPKDREIFCPRADAALKQAGCRQVYLGQGAYLNTVEGTLNQLKYIRDKGFPGTVFYSYRHPGGGQAEPGSVLAAVRESFQPSWVETPALPWKKTKGMVKGTVLNQGKPIYNAVVTIESEPARTQQTEPHGSFAFFNLSPGAYTLTARAGGTPAVSRTVMVEAGRVSSVELSLANSYR